MVASDGFAEFLREQLAPLGSVTMRRMFGKTGVFCDGLMFGMVTDDTLYFRVDDGNRAIFKEAESFPPLNYEKQGRAIDLAFWRAPDRLLEHAAASAGWRRSEDKQRQSESEAAHGGVRSRPLARPAIALTKSGFQHGDAWRVTEHTEKAYNLLLRSWIFGTAWHRDELRGFRGSPHASC